ncbi:M48 family metalloprotease [Spirosoma sp. KCTC 42546]|uniref:M48 family metalloprotease n=1 Tax=Spirosoma sp. KCTC 42546 TaxID=2520506 RepID=UPI001158F06F|nr:M48 family metalloprotease [Spirosoma sp. KCTC 42546]QDK81976.1 M48 family metalloprotease [Spirosoma sp. KCTC 42546]
MCTLTNFRQLIIFIALLFGFACARNPVTGKREISLMSTEQEIAIGKESHPSVIATMGLYEDKNLQAFMNEKGKAMAKVSHRPDLPYQFYIVDSPIVNAFAVPGGYVYFTRGILAHFNNEAEFAGVLGHEIGHITAKHAARSQKSQLLSTIALIGGAVLAPQVVGENIEALQQGLGLLSLKYSRDHESESDKLGVEYSSKIGYDAHQMADFFGTLKRLSDNSGQAIPQFMSTHPDPGNRFTRVHELAKDYQAKNPASYQVDRDRYLRLIDGIMYGEDPKQGFVENGYFYHPELRFQFPVPNSWQSQNSPSQFQMAAKDGKSAMILMLAKGNSLDEAAQNLVKELSLNVLETSKTTINGNPAYVLISRQQQQQQQGQQQQQDPKTALQIGTWLIQYNNAVYALHGLATGADFNSSFSTFKQVAENFRSLSDPDKLNRKAERIVVKSSPRDGSFREVVTALGMPANRVEEAGILNGLKADDRVKRGALVKVISR